MSLPRYPEYKDSGVEWLGPVPAHWGVPRLRFTAQLNPSKSEVRQLPAETAVTFLPMEAIGEDGSVDLSRERKLADVAEGYTFLRDGDVAFAKITPCFENGKGAIMRGLQNGIGFGTTELIVIRPHAQKLSSSFLHYLFTSTLFRQAGESTMYGAGGQKRVPDSFVRDAVIPVPSMDEQAMIGSFLDRETAKIDALLAEQERLIALLKEKRQAVISQAVTKGLNPAAPVKDAGVANLGRIPAHWAVQRLANLSNKITNGYVGPTREILVEDGVRYLQSLHIKANRILFDVPYYVSPSWSDEHAKSILRAGDVLIVQTGDVGQTAVVTPEFDGCNCHALIIVSPQRAVVEGSWVSWVLNSSYGADSLASIQTGALHPHLNCGDVKDVFIPLPPLEEQRRIIVGLENELRRIDTLVEESQQMTGILDQRRSALITAAVTGQIDVRGLASAEAA